MGYFASFLVCHLYFRHRFASTGYPILDQLWRVVLYLGLLTWSGTVAYSRYVPGHNVAPFSDILSRLYLGYHSARQILWGIGIGASLGTSLYTLAELMPRRHPNSILGSTKEIILGNPVSTWLRLRDGWAVWEDGGREGEWIRWKAEWEKQKRAEHTKRST